MGLILIFAVPIMVLMIFGPLLTFFLLLYKKQSQLDSEHNKQIYGFWYLGLKGSFSTG